MAEDKVGFIGAGNIAGAIFNGIVSSGYIKPSNVLVYDPIKEKTDAFTAKGAVYAESAPKLTELCDFVFLTVKPQIYEEVLNSIKFVADNTCFIDVAAGITISYVKSILGANTAVVRVMPNTPLMYGTGSSAIVKDKSVSDAQFNFVKGCFDSSGVTCVVDEKHIDTVTAVSGSAPAYIMLMMNSFIDFATKQGMNAEDAKKIIVGAFSGTANMVNSDKRDIEELIRMVTSPKGTTEEGLSSLNNDNFKQVIDNCLSATLKRAKELSK